MTKADPDLQVATKRIQQYCVDNIEFWSKTMQFAAEANLDTSGALAGDPAEVISPRVNLSKQSDVDKI